MKNSYKLLAICILLFDTAAFSEVVETITIVATRLDDPSDDLELLGSNLDGSLIFGRRGGGSGGALGPIRPEKQNLSLEEKKLQNKHELDKLVIERAFDFVKAFFERKVSITFTTGPTIMDSDGNVIQEGGKEVCLSFGTDKPCFQQQIIQNGDSKVLILTPLVATTVDGKKVLGALRMESVYFFINSQTGPTLYSQLRDMGIDANVRLNCTPSVAHGGSYQTEALNLFINYSCSYGQLIETGVSCKQPEKFEPGIGRSCKPRDCVNMAHGSSEIVDRGFCSGGHRQAEHLRCSFGQSETYYIGHSCPRGNSGHED